MHNAQSVSETKYVDGTQLVEDIDYDSLKGRLETSKIFDVDSEIENERHRVFNYAMDILDVHSLNQKPDTVFIKLNCAAKFIIPFGFVLRDLENGI